MELAILATPLHKPNATRKLAAAARLHRFARHLRNRLNDPGFAAAGLTLRHSTLLEQSMGRRFSNTLRFGD